MKVEKNELWAERADQKHTNNLPLARQFALTAVKLQMFGGKTCHVWHPIRTCFFVSCSHLDATDGSHNFWAQLRLYSLCILQGVGGQRIFFKWVKFFKISPISYRIFSRHPSWPKEDIGSLDKDRRGYKGASTLLFWGPNSISKHFSNWGNWLSLVGILLNM